MEHIHNFDSFLNESREFVGTAIKVGDVVTTASGKPFVVLTTPLVKMGNNFPISFNAIHVYDLELLKKGDVKGRRIFKVQMKLGSYKITGKKDMKDVDLANDVRSDIAKKNADYTDANYAKIEFDSDRMEYYVTAQDGTKVFAGDSVMVRFSNGNFKGTIKQIAGTKTGEIMVVFPGKSKARGIGPEKILKKA